MANARKLPSGHYRVRIYVGKDENGKDIRKSITAPTKKEAEYLASKYAIDMKVPAAGGSLTFGEALDGYISGRESVLSASTVRGYKQLAENNFDSLRGRKIDDITQDDIQRFVNAAYDSGLSSKSVRNMHGLISSVFKKNRPSMRLTTALPPKQKPDLYIPSDDEVVKVINKIRSEKDRDMLIAILLAAYGPMRRSEICALTDADISGNVIHVHKAIVLRKDNTWELKLYPKSEAGDRYISMPDFVIQELKDIKGQIIGLNPNSVTERFHRLLRRAGVPYFRFHDLRHYSASIQHAIGIPDAYIMQRGGWESDSTLKNIYRHALDQEAQKANDKINDYFSKIQNTGHETGHDRKRAQ